MFEPTSRYYAIEEGSYTLPDGRTVVYKRRRFLPSGRELQALAEEAVRPGDRIDLIAARTLGDAEQYWRICDANDAVEPEALCEPGRRLVIPAPES